MSDAELEIVAAMTPKPEPRTFAVRNFIDEAQLKIDLSYSLTNLSDAMQQQAALTSHYSTLAAKAQRQVDDIHLILEATESAVYRQLRDAALKAEDKVTEPQLKQNVSASPRMLAIKRALNEAKQICAVAKGAVVAIRQRKDMLVQEGSTSREERKGELRLMGAAADGEAMDNIKRRLLDRVQGKAV